MILKSQEVEQTSGESGMRGSDYTNNPQPQSLGCGVPRVGVIHISIYQAVAW